MMGTVYLVGAGPGDPELLTVKALRLLQSADVVLYDGLVSDAVLALARGALLVHVGKRCNQRLLTQEEIGSLMVHHASSCRTVVRLKGGDPSLFGRTGEEIDALRAAGITFEIVPGVTSSAAAAAAAQIPLTDRRVASQVLFTTAHRAGEHLRADWDMARRSGATIAIYMPGHDYPRLVATLREAGISGDTPCVIVSSASRASQQIRWTQVERLVEADPLPAPSLLIVGRVAASASETARPSLASMSGPIAIASPADTAPHPQG
jgi:uroporphyrin-III C-methyltransferase